MPDTDYERSPVELDSTRDQAAGAVQTHFELLLGLVETVVNTRIVWGPNFMWSAVNE